MSSCDSVSAIKLNASAFVGDEEIGIIDILFFSKGRDLFSGAKESAFGLVNGGDSSKAHLRDNRMFEFVSFVKAIDFAQIGTGRDISLEVKAIGKRIVAWGGTCFDS